MPNPLWTPSPERIAAAAMTTFRLAAEQHLGRPLPDYRALHAWSVEDPAAFWAFYARYAALPFESEASEIMSADPMPDTRWFDGATLNYAEALLYPKAVSDPRSPAIIGVTEAGERRTLSYGELREEVARVQAALLRSGCLRGDRVAAFAGNLPETATLLLACVSLGVIFSSCSPDFGFEAAQARFAQIAPKLLFVSGGYRYGGRRYDTLTTVRQLADAIPGLQEVVLLPEPGGQSSPREGMRHWRDWLEPAAGAPEFAALPFEQPLYILFSSGTTGLPKAIIHRAGGALLKHHSEQQLHCDIRAGDVVFYFTTCGWMMWNWLLSVLAQGAAIVLYDGSPVYPDLEVLWRLAEELGVTFFGTSARFLHTLSAEGVRPGSSCDLSALRTVASTGSPLSPAGFVYTYREIKKDMHLASISGGTDIVGCFMLGVPTLPVYSGQIQGPALGVDLAAYDERGRPLKGRPGELVCRRPLPSMPLGFWNDPDKERYRAAYFEVFPGVWRHGDLIEVTTEGGILVYGRSDATLNPGGVRIGTAEIYRPLEEIPEVLEAAAVGRKEGADEVIWLFVVLREGVVLSGELVARLKRIIRERASPRHVPKRVFQLSALPRTRSGKAMEIAVSRVVNGVEVPNRSVAANPEAFEEIARVIAGE